jgi:hypothetical protein
MIDPGSVGDWLQASLMAGALGALAAASRWALRMEETEQATPHAVPLRESTGTTTPTPGRAHARRIRSLTRTQRPPGPAPVTSRQVV